MIEVSEAPFASPSPTELFLQDPTGLVLVGILAVLVIGLIVFVKKKAE